MKTITRNDFVKVVRDFKGTTPMDITYRVAEGKSKTKNGKKVLDKEVTTNGMANIKYEDRVNRILENKQGEKPTFKAQGNNGVETAFDKCRCLLKNRNGELMLRLHINSNVTPTTTYFYNGVEISKKEAIENDLFIPSFFTTNTVGRGRVDEENNFHVIQPFLKNIVKVTANKETYILI